MTLPLPIAGAAEATPAQGGDAADRPIDLTLGVGEVVWHDFVVLAGTRGRAWVDRYLADDCRQVQALLAASLADLRAGRLAPGARSLAAASARIDALRPEGADGLRWVMRRWSRAVSAYLRYQEGDCGAAAAELDSARRAAERAIAENRLLVPLAQTVVDLRLQHIRVARRLRRWELAARQVRELLEVGEGRQPFCTPPGVPPVDLAALERFVLALPGLDPAQRARLDHQLDRGVLVRRLHAVVRPLFALPGIVVAYP